MKRSIPFLLLIVLLIAVGCTTGLPNRTPQAPPGQSQNQPEAVADFPQYDAPPEMQIDPESSYTAHFVTSRGEFDIELFADDAPITVNNFVFLAREGFYDGTTFHRVIKTPDPFMAQGGDPTATGSGGPGYRFADEASALAIPHDSPGILSMANAGPNTNGSQFFITFEPTPHQDGIHAVYGKVMDDGMDVVNQIEQGDLIETIEIIEGE